MSPLKWDFLDIYLTTFSEPESSQKQNLWRSAFFQKFQILIYISIMQKNIEKKFFVSHIIVSELVP